MESDNSARNSITAFAMVEMPPMANNSSENGIVSSPSGGDLSNGDHQAVTNKNNKMPDRLAPPDVCHRHQHLKRLGPDLS